MKIYQVILCVCAFGLSIPLSARNPIVSDKGLCDPHIHIFNGKAYCYATHDKSKDNHSFIMEDWWIWSSDDLVNWKHETTISPEQTYIGKDFRSCWAVDVAERHGKYYFYFSEGNRQLGVLVGDSPIGPWHDPLKKPLLASDDTPTREYDMTVFTDTDGVPYLIFGVWDYYIVRLNDDMVSLAEKPRRLMVNNPQGPYGEKTDDKPNLHYRNGKYYLSWGAFYAMADNIYGPYDYKGVVMEESSFRDGCIAPTWPKGFKQGRHGNFFEWHNQWYFAYCDISQTGNRFFRDSFISYVHFNPDGTMARIRVDKTGVGEYNLRDEGIQTEDYFKCEGVDKKIIGEDAFSVSPNKTGAYAFYPKVHGLAGKQKLVMNASVKKKTVVEIRRGSPEGELLLSCPLTPDKSGKTDYIFEMKKTLPEVEDLVLLFPKGGEVAVDSFRFL